MREIAAELAGWREPYALATVVEVRGSAPRQAGAALAVRADGTVVGSVSGGCVEGAVYELARTVLADGVPARERFGYSADDAFAIGLTCGGELEVFVNRIDPHDPASAVTAASAAGRPVALATVTAGPPRLLGRLVGLLDGKLVGSTGDSALDGRISRLLTGMLDRGEAGAHRLGRCGTTTEIEVFAQAFARPARMLVFGATDHAAAVAGVGRYLGYHVTVCDARAIFATTQRFPEADEVVVDWPHRYLAGIATDSRTVVCVLTHDPKFDVPVLAEALHRPIGYVGALGSRRTHADRLVRLRAAGVTDGELARLHSPIGLDLGACTPEETALSIAAEIVAVRRGGSGRPLSTTDGPIHRTAATEHADRVA